MQNHKYLSNMTACIKVSFDSFVPSEGSRIDFLCFLRRQQIFHQTPKMAKTAIAAAFLSINTIMNFESSRHELVQQIVKQKFSSQSSNLQKNICFLFGQQFLHPLDGKYCSATTPLVYSDFTFSRSWKLLVWTNRFVWIECTSRLQWVKFHLKFRLF